MDDNKLEELITNLELVGYKLNSLSVKNSLTGSDRELLDQSLKIIRQTLDDLRIVEVTREIESFSS